VRHAAIIRPDGIADSRVGSPVSASSGGISISQNRSNSGYNPRLDLSHDANSFGCAQVLDLCCLLDRHVARRRRARHIERCRAFRS
jgi:hypothetical protein